MKLKLSKWHEPTPKSIKRVADSILYGLGAVGASALFNFEQLQSIFTPSQIRWGVGIVLVVAFACKFFSNFLTIDNEQ